MHVNGMGQHHHQPQHQQYQQHHQAPNMSQYDPLQQLATANGFGFSNMPQQDQYSGYNDMSRMVFPNFP
jgi:hypothetical protein